MLRGTGEETRDEALQDVDLLDRPLRSKGSKEESKARSPLAEERPAIERQRPATQEDQHPAEAKTREKPRKSFLTRRPIASALGAILAAAAMGAGYTYFDYTQHFSLRAALILVLGLGLPLTAFFVAFNPAWGFTWYFNTESWATGVYQKLTEARVDDWRAAMTGAVRRAYGGESDDLFAIDPGGLEGSRDFSFLVVGDPGEGDASQYALISRYLELGRRDDLKFLVVSSDVIYPAGAIEDYERNFYLPFQGFAKPVYAIPGNHDWYDALEGFNANFLEPKAARAAIEARVEADHGLTSTNARRMDRLVAEAARLRGLYGVSVAHQRAPFFELQTQDFALLAIDTGILRSVDERQWAWLGRALDRSRGKFTMAIVGHPRFAGGHDTPPTAEGGDVSDASGNFAELYRLLANRNVKIAMAGDTHDFEYYKEKVGRQAQCTTSSMAAAALTSASARPSTFRNSQTSPTGPSIREQTTFAQNWRRRRRCGRRRSGVGSHGSTPGPLVRSSWRFGAEKRANSFGFSRAYG